MKYCPRCGTQMDDSAKFCPACGQAFNMPVTPQQTPDSPEKQKATGQIIGNFLSLAVWAAIFTLGLVIYIDDTSSWFGYTYRGSLTSHEIMVIAAMVSGGVGALISLGEMMGAVGRLNGGSAASAAPMKSSSSGNTPNTSPAAPTATDTPELATVQARYWGSDGWHFVMKLHSNGKQIALRSQNAEFESVQIGETGRIQYTSGADQAESKGEFLVSFEKM